MNILKSLRADLSEKEKQLEKALMDIKRKEDLIEKNNKDFKDKEARKQHIQDEYKKIIEEIKIDRD